MLAHLGSFLEAADVDAAHAQVVQRAHVRRLEFERLERRQQRPTCASSVSNSTSEELRIP